MYACDSSTKERTVEVVKPGIKVSNQSIIVTNTLGTSFSVVLNSRPSGDVTVRGTLTDATNLAFGAPHSGGEFSLLFTPENWETPQSVTVNPINEVIGNLDFQIVFNSTLSADRNYNEKTIASVDGKFIGQDRPAQIYVIGDVFVVTNQRGTQFQVSLSNKPKSDVTVSGELSNKGLVKFADPYVNGEFSLTFTPENYNVPQVVTLEANGWFYGNSEFTVDFDNSVSNDKNYSDKAIVSLKGFTSGQLDNVLIFAEYNPYGNAPLSAELTVMSDTPVRVSYEVLDTDGEVNIRRDYTDFNTLQTKPLIGLYGDSLQYMENTVNIYAYDGNGQELQKKTQKITTYIPSNIQVLDFNIEVADRAKMQRGWNYHTRSGIYPANISDTFGIYDSYGKLRWLFHYPSDNFDRPFKMIDNNTNFVINGHNIDKYSLSGKLLASCDIVSKYFLATHHDIDIMPNGHLLVAIDNPSTLHLEDYIIELDIDTCNIVKRWDLSDYLDATHIHDLIISGVDASIDWFHNNSIQYIEEDNSIVLSGRHQGVVKIDYNITDASGIKWIFAPHRNWKTPQKEHLLIAVDATGVPYSAEVQDGLVAAGDGFDWSWGQHTAKFENNVLTAFDNGDFRRFKAVDGSSYSRVASWEIDEGAMTVKQVFEYGKDNPRLYNRVMSLGERLANGNYLGAKANYSNVHTGEVYMVEVNDIGNIVFESSFPNAIIYRQGRVDLLNYYREYDF